MKNIFIKMLALVTITGCAQMPKIMTQGPSPQQTLEELYASGKTERINGAADKCLKTFGKIIDLRKTIQDGLYAYSLYQSGLCHEMKNENERAIAVYQDALRVKAIVNSELADLEIPSRLAIVYSRAGELDAAEKYYQQANKFILGLKNNKNQLYEKKSYYAEVLFQMGTIANQYQASKESSNDFESYLKSIRYSQDYLMLVLELAVEPYATLAFNQMINNFQKTYDVIKNMQSEKLDDMAASDRSRQNIQKIMSAQLAEHIDEFEVTSNIQKKSVLTNYKEIFIKLKEIKAGLDSIINERPVGEGLTPEAQKLRAPKIEGTFAPPKGEQE